MDRLLSLLLALLLIGGIYYDSVNRANHAHGSFGYRATISDNIGTSKSNGIKGAAEGCRGDIQRSRPNSTKTPNVLTKDVSRFNRPPDYKLEVTAYTHTGRPTKSGAWPKIGCVAVDPNIIPLGSKLFIEGYGYATALDTGANIQGDRMDLFMETRSRALKYGRKYNVRVWVIK